MDKWSVYKTVNNFKRIHRSQHLEEYNRLKEIGEINSSFDDFQDSKWQWAK